MTTIMIPEYVIFSFSSLIVVVFFQFSLFRIFGIGSIGFIFSSSRCSVLVSKCKLTTKSLFDPFQYFIKSISKPYPFSNKSISKQCNGLRDVQRTYLNANCLVQPRDEQKVVSIAYLSFLTGSLLPWLLSWIYVYGFCWTVLSMEQ